MHCFVIQISWYVLVFMILSYAPGPVEFFILKKNKSVRTARRNQTQNQGVVVVYSEPELVSQVIKYKAERAAKSSHAEKCR